MPGGYLRDIQSNVVGNVSILPIGLRTASFTGAWVDLIQGDGLATVAILPGNITDGNFTFGVEESSDASNTTNTTVTLQESLPVISNTTVANATVPIIAFANFNRSLRYARVTMTAAATTTGGNFTAALLEQKKFVAQ